MKRFITKRNSLMFLAILFLLIAWNREINLLYGMFALLCATLIVSHILPRYSIRGISASRQVPSTAFEGDEMDIQVSVENKSLTSRYMLEVVDLIPAAEPGHQTPMTFIGKLSGSKTREYIFKLACYKRGEYTVGPLEIKSAYPLGIAKAENSQQGNMSTLLVYPEVFDIAKLPLVSKGSMLTSGIEAFAKTGGSEDFFGTREYRQGDSLRFIHWPSSAKHNQLIVKEFEIRASTEVTIIIDLHRGSDIGVGKETTLEYAVKIAASIAKYVVERGHSLQFVGYGKYSHIISYSRGFNQLARVMETLARVTADGNIPYHLAISRCADLLRDGGTVILLFSGQNSNINDYLYAVGLLKAKRIRPLCVFINKNSFLDKGEPCQPETNPLAQEFIGTGAPVYFVSKGDKLREIFGT
jgi:uncharacterized protein (DUF58 family)